MGPSWYIADDRVTGGSTWKAAVKKKVKKLVRSALKHLDIGITSYSKLKELEVIRDSKVSESADIDLLLSLPDPSQLLPLIRRSKSQLRQDLFVLSVLNFKRAGFFVEFGATDGVTLSNTYLLEKEFGWRGILAEPARCWHKDLRSNRSGIIENRCVWRDSNSVLSFNEAEASELSTINSYTDADSRADARRKGERYDVRTISLTDLLDQNKAPRRIDYLSIDTEGSELELPRFGGHMVVLDPISRLPRFYRSYNAARSAAGRRQKLWVC